MRNIFMYVFLLLITSQYLFAQNMPEVVNAGMNAYNNNQYDQAYKLFMKAAKLGDSQAQNNLGTMYLGDAGLDIDYKKAKYWLEKSAAQHNPSAYYNLGNLYYYGHGVKQDSKKAADIYEEGISYGDNSCGQRLGFMYFQGKLLARDLIKAYLYFSLAASLNDQNSANMLAVVSKQMTQAQLDEANQLVENFKFEDNH